MTKKHYAELRSHRWYGVDNLRAFGHRSRTKQMGFSRQDFDGKPVIGILNTWSDLAQCHAHFKSFASSHRRVV